MENDANCLALSEAVDGAAAEARVVFGVILGTGVGGGIVINRQLHVERNKVAGEWGHNPLPWARGDELPGPECYCGKRGCIETFLSGSGLTRDYHARTGQQASIINVLDPDAIVLGGGLSNLTCLYPALPPLLKSYTFSADVGTPIVRAMHGDSSGVRGAAWLWPISGVK